MRDTAERILEHGHSSLRPDTSDITNTCQYATAGDSFSEQMGRLPGHCLARIEDCPLPAYYHWEGKFIDVIRILKEKKRGGRRPRLQKARSRASTTLKVPLYAQDFLKHDR